MKLIDLAQPLTCISLRILGSRDLLSMSTPMAGKRFCTALRPAAGGDHEKVLQNEQDLWILLKDCLVRPMLADLRAALGLPAPAGLTNLPLELTDRLLQHLGVS